MTDKEMLFYIIETEGSCGIISCLDCPLYKECSLYRKEFTYTERSIRYRIALNHAIKLGYSDIIFDNIL